MIKSLLTWQAVEWCPVTFDDLVTGDSCHKFFSVPTRFLSLGQIGHKKANTAGVAELEPAAANDANDGAI